MSEGRDGNYAEQIENRKDLTESLLTIWLILVNTCDEGGGRVADIVQRLPRSSQQHRFERRKGHDRQCLVSVLLVRGLRRMAALCRPS